MDWKALENSLIDSARATLEALLAEGVAPLYAAAFHASYREEERVIDLPSFAANSLVALDEDHPRRKQEGFWGVRWNPADWRWDWQLDDYANAALSALDEPLQTYANRAGPDAWQAAEQRFLRTVARAAKALNRIYAKDPRVAKDFIVFFHDEYGGPELAAKSLSPRQFLQHFPEQDFTEQERRRVAALAEDQQVSYYLSCLSRPQPIDAEEASRWLIARGASATAALLHRLQKGPDRWRAAMILGLAGVADTAAIVALRGQVVDGKEPSTRNWSASALGYLGDVDWLLAQAADPQLATFAVAGCCANLRAFRDQGAQGLVVDYRPLETLLQRHPQCAGDVEQTIKPGSSYCTISNDDIEEVVRGLASEHVAIRRHAACVLDNRRLGKRKLAPALIALRACLNDPDPKVVYLAGLTLDSLQR
ncbi:DUF4303 domain-containing protein [Pseudomonas rubra]|uniref:DUF4303 domain-containing protein n=1 Tax=Pseudomonas rubra TaxID=2942627 RepID=A0ABT5PGN8_9PSED|nr:DUF4303 domain-containing protein [Pseudomonas rubra]MDD1017178.1 DUF4303 domain-containing protein [Pseudomonas rubra]MDD1041205.1 DUF4303 domain-containing protein [Pseudomonas rubra]MDD1158007.1 DUF4303 domain-containing protein [Pseudomonas rubra]